MKVKTANGAQYMDSYMVSIPSDKLVILAASREHAQSLTAVTSHVDMSSEVFSMHIMPSNYRLRDERRSPQAKTVILESISSETFVSDESIVLVDDELASENNDKEVKNENIETFSETGVQPSSEEPVEENSASQKPKKSNKNKKKDLDLGAE
jgi:hypothetical protein